MRAGSGEVLSIVCELLGGIGAANCTFAKLSVVEYVDSNSQNIQQGERRCGYIKIRTSPATRYFI